MRERAGITVHVRSIDTPCGRKEFRFYDWQGPKNGIISIDDRFARQCLDSLPWKMLKVSDSRGDWQLYTDYVRADCPAVVRWGYTIRAAWNGFYPMALYRARWVAILFGLAEFGSAQIENPIGRWRWQKRKVEPPAYIGTNSCHGNNQPR